MVFTSMRQTLQSGSFTCFLPCSYDTTIPRQVGLSGSSSIIIATLRALLEFYSIPVTPSWCSDIEWIV